MSYSFFESPIMQSNLPPPTFHYLLLRNAPGSEDCISRKAFKNKNLCKILRGKNSLKAGTCSLELRCVILVHWGFECHHAFATAGTNVALRHTTAMSSWLNFIFVTYLHLKNWELSQCKFPKVVNLNSTFQSNCHVAIRTCPWVVTQNLERLMMHNTMYVYGKCHSLFYSASRLLWPVPPRQSWPVGLQKNNSITTFQESSGSGPISRLYWEILETRHWPVRIRFHPPEPSSPLSYKTSVQRK